jgi:tetratricopeptide (TPR) repeat protein
VVRFGPLVHGPFTVSEIRERLRDVPPTAHVRDILEAHIAFVEGRYADALAINTRVIARVSELGVPILLGPPMTARAGCLREAGEIEEALEAGREVNALLESTGHTSFLSTGLVELGVTHHLAGDLDEAERLAIAGEELGAAEDVINFARGRRVRALVAADRGDLDRAEELARDSFAHAYRTDFPAEHGEAHETLAYVLRAAGRTDGARAEYALALAEWERYDWKRRAERVRRLLVEL